VDRQDDPDPRELMATPVKVNVPRLRTVRAPQADLDPGNVQLQDRALSVQLRSAITDMSVDQTIDGASTLSITVSDYSGAFLRSALLAGPVTASFDRLSWTLVKLSKGDRTVTLTFEEQAVNLLRQYDSPKKASRDSGVTRAQFVRSLITEVTQAQIPYSIPEINQRQPVAN
jgi:hypothetical protein